jgi:hypothetical protein
VQLGVDDPGVVVLDGDHDGLAEVARPVVLVAVAGDPVAWLEELGRRIGVDVQQRARLAPLKAPVGLTLSAPPT